MLEAGGAAEVPLFDGYSFSPYSGGAMRYSLFFSFLNPLVDCAISVCRRCGTTGFGRPLSNCVRASGSNFVVAVAGMACVAAFLAVLPAVGLGADDSVAEPVVTAAADAGVTATGYRPNVMSNETRPRGPHAV